MYSNPFTQFKQGAVVASSLSSSTSSSKQMFSAHKAGKQQHHLNATAVGVAGRSHIRSFTSSYANNNG
jgi:hypothetical protein